MYDPQIRRSDRPGIGSRMSHSMYTPSDQTMDKLLAAMDDVSSPNVLVGTGGASSQLGPHAWGARNLTGDASRAVPTAQTPGRAALVGARCAQAVADDDDDDASSSKGSEWDMVGSDTDEPMAAAMATSTEPYGNTDAASQARHAARMGGGGRTAGFRDADDLNRVPTFSTGDPIYTYQDPGGAPGESNEFYRAVKEMGADVMQRQSTPKVDAQPAPPDPAPGPGSAPVRRASTPKHMQHPPALISTNSDEHLLFHSPGTPTSVHGSHHTDYGRQLSPGPPGPSPPGSPMQATRHSSFPGPLSDSYDIVGASTGPASMQPHIRERHTGDYAPPATIAGFPRGGSARELGAGREPEGMYGYGRPAAVHGSPMGGAMRSNADWSTAMDDRALASLQLQTAMSGSRELASPIFGSQQPMFLAYDSPGSRRPSRPYGSDGTFKDCELAFPGKKIERWQEIPRQAHLVQKQIKQELCGAGSIIGEPLGHYHFHIPLFAATWGLVREAAVVPTQFTRGYKELLGAAVSRGNHCRFCCYWDTNAGNDADLEGMQLAWRKKTMQHFPLCPLRYKAVMRWFRDANRAEFFSDRRIAPFTDSEAAELIGVSFLNHYLNRVTMSHQSTDETMPVMGMLRPFMSMFPGLQSAMYKSVLKPNSSNTPPPGRSAEVRPRSRHHLQGDLAWASNILHLSQALRHLDFVVNFHLRGRFLPLDLCSDFRQWMDANYTGINHDKVGSIDLANQAARQAFPTDVPRREAMKILLLVACSPGMVPQDWQAQLARQGWRQMQVNAMPPFAAFHAARVICTWQAAAPRASSSQSRNENLWRDLWEDDSDLW